jgi:hypothetical protein
MNQDDIIRMAREAAKNHPAYNPEIPDPEGDELAVFERFASIVATAYGEQAKEACANAAFYASPNGIEVAAAIRSMQLQPVTKDGE